MSQPGGTRGPGLGRPARRAMGHAAAGAMAGYALLHPAAMMIFRALDHSGPGGGSSGSILSALGESFRPHMLPMGLLFAALCAAVGAADGWLHGVVLDQRQELARLLERLETEHAELSRLHEAHRRSIRFLVHDFKTHLGCILGFVELLEGSPAVRRDPSAADAVFRIGRQARKLGDGVATILDFERMRRGFRGTQELLAVDDLFSEIHEVFEVASREGRLVVAPPGAATAALVVTGDRPILVRVLMNLVSNALAHAPADAPVVLSARTQEPGWVEITCHDEGPGVPPELLPHLFEEFSSGRGSSGLGLAFCKAAVEAHGGTIRCENTTGRGCTFVVRLPGPDAEKGDAP